ncbi:MAG: cell division protein FtsL [Pseudomonadota bacterium]|nr:MAG: cell division protein FtsL [Pseudomonadota bacterium]
MSRHLGLILVLLAAISCALLVVHTRHESRQLFARQQSLQAERDALTTEWERLLLEEAAWAQHRRIESTARARLGMDLPVADRIVVVPLVRSTQP